MDARDGAQTIRREKFVFIKHVAQGALQSLARWDRQHAIAGERAHVAISDQAGKVLAVIQKPLHSFLESRQLVDLCRLKIFHRDQGQQSDERTRSQRDLLPIHLQFVVEEAVLLVPQACAAEGIHRVADADEVLEEFRSHVFVDGIVFRELDRNR